MFSLHDNIVQYSSGLT